jgi:hypothetical protein
MRRAGAGICLPLLFLLAAAAATGQPEEPFRPKGSHDNSVHRFHPDLDARLNLVRYACWRTFEIAWKSGVTSSLDSEVSAYVARLLRHPPRLAPEADRVAPLLARGAPPIFRALRWGQTLEQQFLDALAASDASPSLSEARVDRALMLYRRERYALSEPSETAGVEPGSPSASAPDETAARRLLSDGTRLFALASADLAKPDFAQQRWMVRQTVSDFDKSFGSGHPREDATYAVSAAAVAGSFSSITKALDRLQSFRADVLDALAGGGGSEEARRQRDERLHEVARRYGLPVSGIGRRRWSR